tara:strand:- start:225 stop:425 length:201 start_codon:yes stop_codon:yes gene_type:complete
MAKKKISFEESMEDTDFGLIISAEGELKGMYIPEEMDEMEYMPQEIMQILEDVYGMNLPDSTATIH